MDKEEKDAYQEKRIEELKANKDGDKCRFFEKLLIFNELIKALVEWKNKKYNQTEEKVLEDLSFVPVMKCLYITCLLSIDIKDSNNKSSLFDIFRDFYAFPRGGVDMDCYYFMDRLPEYTIEYTIADKDGSDKLSKRRNSNSSNNNLAALTSQINTVPLTETEQNKIVNDKDRYSKMLNDAIEVLKNASSFPGFKEKGRLSELTHMNIWRNAWNSGSPKMTTVYNKDLLEEAIFLRWCIGALNYE